MSSGAAGPTRLKTGVHEEYLSQAQELGGRLRGRADATLQEVLTVHAQAGARELDDNHVGTEHVVLALLLQGDNAAAEVLTEAGITVSSFKEVLDDEAGPSPAGPIPYTTRAVMIGGLAVDAADQRGHGPVEPLHLLLGVVAESARWDRQHAWGPHHLRNAAEAAGTTLDRIEARADEQLAVSHP
jgi:ATP-dependent Clp protease ATP-binding subunit ClpA